MGNLKQTNQACQRWFVSSGRWVDSVPGTIFVQVLRARILIVALLLILAGPKASAAAITFNTALPVSQGELILREQLVASDLGVATQQSLNTVLGYGVTPKLAVFGVLPVTRIELDNDAGRDLGLGDASVFVRYEVFRRDAAGATLRLAPFAGVRLPSATDDLLGDDSTDALLGLVLTSATTKRIIDTQIAWELNGSNSGNRAGHRGSFDLSLQYRAWPKQPTEHTRGFVYAVIESSVIYQDQSSITDGQLEDGGWQWFLSPGIQYVRQRFIADLAVRLPVATDLDQDALRADYSVLASIRLNF